MAASCESSRPVSFFSNASSFFASSRVPSNVSRIFTKARMTNTLTRDRPIARSHHHATNAVHPTASPHVVFIWTARVLRRTFAACRAPCSVKA